MVHARAPKYERDLGQATLKPQYFVLDCRIPSEPSETPLINRTDPWSREGVVQVRKEVMVWVAAGVHEAPYGGEAAFWGS